MKDIIILKKSREKKELSRGIKDTIPPAEIVETSNPVDFGKKYK